MRKLLAPLVFFAAFTACSSSRPKSSIPSEPIPADSTEPAIGTSVPIPLPSPLPGLYHRIYEGYTVDGLKRKEFTKEMNKKFLPLFPKAHSVGLVAYRSALPKSPKACDLPNEVELLSFGNEKDFGKFKGSKIGKGIVKAHTPIFRSDKSHTFVAEAPTDTFRFGHAYSLNPGMHDYRKSYSTLIVHCDPAKTPDELRIALVKAYAAGTQATDILFALTPTHVLEYVFYPKESDAASRVAEREERFRSVFREFIVIPLKKEKIAKPKIVVGDGIDAQL